jgi:large subunit ribosomal protein L29
MKASDLREKSVEDLRELQASLAHDTFQNRLKNFTNRLDDTSVIGKTRRDLARVITLLYARKLGEVPASAPAEAAPQAAAAPVARSAAKPAKAEKAPKAPKAEKKNPAKKGEAPQS